MAYTDEIDRANSLRNDKTGHSVGWPHYDRHGNCICLCPHCFGKAGCVCRYCPGHNHANCKLAHDCEEANCSRNTAVHIVESIEV